MPWQTLRKRSQGVLSFIQRENMNTLHCTNSPRAKRGRRGKQRRSDVGYKMGLQKATMPEDRSCCHDVIVCEIITKLLADASLNNAWLKWMQYVKKGREGFKMSMVAFLVSFLASTARCDLRNRRRSYHQAVLDLFQMASVSTISFLSGCTVLSMSLYSVGRAAASRDSVVDFKSRDAVGHWERLSAAFKAKQLFTAGKEAASNPNMVGGVQAGSLTISYNLHARFTL